MFRPWFSSKSSDPAQSRASGPSTHSEDAQPNEAINRRQQQPPAVRTTVPPRRVNRGGPGRGRGGHVAVAGASGSPSTSLVELYQSQHRGRYATAGEPGPSNAINSYSFDARRSDLTTAHHPLPSRPPPELSMQSSQPPLVKRRKPHFSPSYPSAGYSASQPTASRGEPASASQRPAVPYNSHSSNATDVPRPSPFNGHHPLPPKPLPPSSQPPPLKRRKIDPADVHRLHEPLATQPRASRADPESTPQRSSSAATLVEELKVKKERSPSPAVEYRKLSTTGSKHYPIIPPECQKGKDGWKNNRSAWASREANVLRRMGLLVKRTMVREDGMVIDWESPRPIYVDTLEPDPSDLGGVIERAAFDNYSALQSVQSPKSSLPSSTQADGGRPPTPRRTSKSPKVEGTESISSSELVERILDRSGTSSRTSTPARTPPNVRPPVSDMSPPAGSQSSHLSQPSSSSPRPLAVIRMLKKSRTSWSPEHSVAGNVSSIALDHPTPLHSNTLSQPLEVLGAPPSTYCDSSSTHTAVRSGAGAREAESIFQKPLVFVHYEPPAPTVEPPSDPHTLALPPSNPLPEEADDRAVYEDDDDLYEGSLGYPDDDALAYNEPCADFGLPSAWPTPEESADMERAALDFLNDYVLTFDSDRSRLASAYSRDATFSYRTYCNDPALAARIDAFALPQGFLRAHELIQGRLDVLSALLSLGSAKLSSSENIDYDFTHMGKGIGGLLVVYGTLYDPQADGRLYVTQSFVLRRKDSDPEDRLTEGLWPVVAVVHQMVIRDAPQRA